MAEPNVIAAAELLASTEQSALTSAQTALVAAGEAVDAAFATLPPMPGGQTATQLLLTGISRQIGVWTQGEVAALLNNYITPAPDANAP